MDFDDLTKREQRAVTRLQKLAKTWPKSLGLFSNSGSLEVHKNRPDGAYDNDTFIEDIYGIPNDGGDRG